MTVERIGLMFGSYNPPHEGHVKTADTAKEQENLDLVYMIPVSRSPLKKNTLQATFNDKVRMCQIIAEPHSDWLRVLDSGSDFPSQKLDGLRNIKNIVRSVSKSNPNSELFIVAGDDFRKKFIAAVTSLEISRFIANKISTVGSLFDLQFTQNLANRLEMACRAFDTASVLNLPRSTLDNGEEISSSDIREKIQNGLENIAGLPTELRNYILSNGLYNPQEAFAEPS